MCYAQKQMHIKDLIKLKQQEDIIDKNIEIFIDSIKIPPNILAERNADIKSRMRIINALNERVNKIAKEFEDVKFISDQLKSDEKLNIEDCKLKMLDFSEKTRKFDLTNEIESLEKEQNELEDYLISFSINLKKLIVLKNGSNVKKMINLEQNINMKDYNKFKNFNDLIGKSGHTENWKESDHNYFVKIRDKCDNISDLIKEIQIKFPDISSERIINHEKWYKVYLDLREKQKDSIKTWRVKKDLERKEKIEALKNTENQLNKPVDKKYLIQKWKMEKEQKEAADNKLISERKEMLKNWNEKKFLLRSAELKESIANYKQMKKEKLQSILTNSVNNKNNNKTSSALLKIFRERDDSFINRKKKVIESKRRNSNKDDNSVGKLRINCKSKSESTLMKPTKVWENKCKSKASDDIPKPVLYIKNIPKFSINHWKNPESIS